MKPTIPKTAARFAGAVLLAAASVWTARADFASTLQSHNPLAYWQFTEPAASPAPFTLANLGSVGSFGDAHAISTVVNGVTGKVNKALQFNNAGGTAFDDAKADVYYHPNLATKTFTVEFWANPSTITLGGAFDSTGSCPLSDFSPNGSGSSRIGWLFYLAPNGKWNFRLGLTSGYAVSLIPNSGVATANTWQHIVATYDGLIVNLYANGVLIGSQASDASVTGWKPNPNSFVRVGAGPLVGSEAFTTDDGGFYLPWDVATPVSGNRGWDGLIDEVAIYTNVLSPSTIAAHYAAAATPATYGATILADHPTGYWPFDESTVTTPTGPFPLVANSGSLGSAADGTNLWGAVAGQPGPGFMGFPATDKAVTFDGVLGSTPIKYTPALVFPASGSTITLAAWVKPLAANYQHNILEQGESEFGAETFLRVSRGYNYGDTTGYGYYEVGTTEGAQNDGWYDSALFPIPAGDIGKWVFLVGTFDGANWNLYRNGVLVAQTPAYDGGDGDFDYGPYNVNTNWTIGAWNHPSIWDGNNYAGSIAEPAIFSTLLSASDIQTLYNAAEAPPVFTVAPQNPGVVFKNSTVSLTASADGAPPLGYLWTSNGIPTGNTTTSFSIAGIQNGTYTIGVTATNAFGTNTSLVTFTVVSAPPVFTSTPLPQTRFVGYPFTLSASAGGTTPLTYYWYLGSTLVQAGASASYTATASLANGGNYSVVVSNETSVTITSPAAAVTVNSVPSGYPQAVVGSSPLAYWRLDESSGSTAFDTVSGINGTYNNTTLGLPGYSVLDPDFAAGFSGTGSYVGDISGTLINFTNNANLTLEAWVNAPAGQLDQATIIAKGIGNTGTTETEQFCLDVATGAYRFFTTYNGTTGNDGTKYEADATTGPNGTWQHVVGVYDGQNALGGGQKLYIYVNGVLEGSASVPTKGQTAGSSPVSIGSKRTGNDPAYDGTFNGTIDEVAVYGTALSASDVYNHYSAAYGTTLAPFINVQPVPTTNYDGLPVTLSVVAAGSQPLTYQWYKGTTPVGGNSGTYTISPVDYTDAGNYYVHIANNVGSINSTTNPLVVLAPPTTPPAIPGLVLHLPFNNNLVDVTGRGNNGTGIHTTFNTNTLVVTSNAVSPNVSNPSFFYTDGPFPGTNALHYSTVAALTNVGKSIGLDDYYVTIGVKPDLQFGSNINFTVSYWIRTQLGYGLGPDYGGGGDLPFFTTALTSLGGNGFDFATDYAYGTQNPPTTAPAVAGAWAVTMYGAGAGVRLYGGTGSINDAAWHNLIHVMNRASGRITTYLDGVQAAYTLAGGTTLTAAGNIDSGNPATVGQDPSGLYGEMGSGDIADLGVWRRALTPLEAAAIYTAGFNNGLSYAYVPPVFTSSFSGGSVTLTWNLGTLQSSASVAGPYTDVNSGSPYTTSTATGNKFFRVRYTYQ